MMLKRFFIKIIEKIDDFRLRRFLYKEMKWMIDTCHRHDHYFLSAAWTDGKRDDEGYYVFQTKMTFKNMSTRANLHVSGTIYNRFLKEAALLQEGRHKKVLTNRGEETIITMPVQFLVNRK